jgi:hypothetical protein
MSSTASVQFRCPGCQRLLSVSRSRAGSAVTCPRCQSSLIVPDSIDPIGAVDSKLAPTPADTRGDAGSSPSNPAVEPAFPSLVLDPEPLSLRPNDSKLARASRRASSASNAPSSTATPATRMPGLDTSSNDLRTPGSSPTTEPRSVHAPPPRSALAAWGLVVLLALVFAFTSGLLVGHFLWRS